MNSNLFEKAFVHVLHEAPEPAPAPAPAADPNAGVSDAQAMNQTLDKGTNPADFNTDAGAAADHIEATTKMQATMVSSLQSWIGQLEQFSKFLNGTDPNSVQSKLKNCIPDTLFDKIRVAETKKIARVSMEVTSLNEMLKGYLASEKDPKYKGV
jgi:hypothetical protein